MERKTGEIINIQIGQCGNQIGNAWLDKILREHQIGYDGIYQKNDEWNEINALRLDMINSYFDEIAGGTLTNGYIRQKIESKYKLSSEIPNEIVSICKQYTRSFDSNRYRARSILIDSDPGILDVIKTSPIADLLNPNNFIFGESSFGNNWYMITYIFKI